MSFLHSKLSTRYGSRRRHMAVTTDLYTFHRPSEVRFRFPPSRFGFIITPILALSIGEC